MIRKISERFKVNSDVFKKSYDLKNNFEAASFCPISKFQHNAAGH
jgi:hypothetical protein